MRKITTIGLLLLAVALALAAPAALAQPGDYSLDWWTVDGGGTTFLENNGYTLDGTVGQPDAHVWSDSGYTLVGGFWGGGEVQYCTYLPLVLKE